MKLCVWFVRKIIITQQAGLSTRLPSRDHSSTARATRPREQGTCLIFSRLSRLGPTLPHVSGWPLSVTARRSKVKVATATCWPRGPSKREKAGSARRAEKHIPSPPLQTAGLCFLTKTTTTTLGHCLGCFSSLAAKKTRARPDAFITTVLSGTSSNSRLLTCLAKNRVTARRLRFKWPCSLRPGWGRGEQCTQLGSNSLNQGSSVGGHLPAHPSKSQMPPTHQHAPAGSGVPRGYIGTASNLQVVRG